MKVGALVKYFIRPEILRYGLVAGFITIYNLAIFWVLEQALPPTESFLLAYVITVLTRFALDKWWTFRNTSRETARQLLNYAIISVASGLLGWALFTGFLLLWDNGLLANALSIPPRTLLVFFLFHTRVFRDKGVPRPSGA